MVHERIIGVGLDLVGLTRIREALACHGEPLLARICTSAERAAVRDAADPAVRLALAFALKEAVLKALGTGWAEGLAFRQVEILLPGGDHPVSLSGTAATRAEQMGVRRWLAGSGTAGDGLVAFVLALGAPPGDPANRGPGETPPKGARPIPGP